MGSQNEGVPPAVDVYAVGVLAELLRLGRSLRARHPQAIRHALGRLRWTGSYLIGQARARNWRAVRNTFNGYLAEHRSLGSRAGRGWTRRRALADLYRHLAEIGADRG